MKIGAMELILIFIVALVVIGPEKMPYYAKKLGETLAQFKKATDAATKDIKESVIDPLEEAQRPIREAMAPVEELNQAVNGNFKDLTKSFNDIGKQKPRQSTTVKEQETGAAGSGSESEVTIHTPEQDAVIELTAENGTEAPVETGTTPVGQGSDCSPA